MPGAPEPVFLVQTEADPVTVVIRGRASYLNCGPLNDFFAKLMAAGRRQFVVDGGGCQGMDSTFLGILAGVAQDLRELRPPGVLALVRFCPRHLDLVRNLGIDRLLVLAAEQPAHPGAPPQPLTGGTLPEEESARLILRAHERLIEADAANLEKFEDVITFLRQQVG